MHSFAVPDEETPEALERQPHLRSVVARPHAAERRARQIFPGCGLILPKAKLRCLQRASMPSTHVWRCRSMNGTPAASAETLERVDRLAGREHQRVVWCRTASRNCFWSVLATAIAPLQALEPDAIRAHAAPQLREVVLRFRGLAFARWSEGCVTFGMDGHWEELNRGQRSSAEAVSC